MRWILLLMLIVTGCGTLEQTYDEMNYESLTNEVGTIHVYSGGKEVATYANATVLYTDSNSQCMWIKLPNGDKIYIQGDLIMEIDK